jgi:gas vesicle protein
MATLVAFTAMADEAKPLTRDAASLPERPVSIGETVPPSRDFMTTPPEWVRPERPLKIQRPDRLERPERPTRPERPDRPQLPEEIRELITKFEEAREVFLQQQRDKLRELREVTEDKREELREKIRQEIHDARQELLAQQQAIREQVKERIEEMRDQFQNRERDRVLDAADKTADPGNRDR